MILGTVWVTPGVIVIAGYIVFFQPKVSVNVILP